MAWLKRLFGMGKPQNAQVNPQPQQQQQQQFNQQQNFGGQQSAGTNTQQVPPERMGLNGEYDQSGLAKRVALAFDETPNLTDIDTLWVAQTGSTVVLKGKVPNQQMLNQMVSVARGVRGASNVDTSQVSIG